MRKISESSFTIASNGYGDGPAQPLRDFLLDRGAKCVITVVHPLVPEGNNKHIITTYKNGKIASKQYSLPHRPPYTYIFDPFVPLKLPPTTAWFGFNNLAALRGLRRRQRGKTSTVVYWAVDFVPNRFGKGIATRGYNFVDRKAASQSDGRVELSKVGVTGRNNYLGLDKNKIAPTQVVPMGAWFDKTPKVTVKSWAKKQIVFLGHLQERQGVVTLIEAMSKVHSIDPNIHLSVIGSGPMEKQIKKLSKQFNLSKVIKFHGFVKDHKDVEKLLADATVAIAPYRKEKNFVQFSDAGKLKAYLGAGLPIILTDVPSNTGELVRAGVAFVAGDSSNDLAHAILDVFKDKNVWLSAHMSALAQAKRFDWNVLLEKALKNVGFV